MPTTYRLEWRERRDGERSGFRFANHADRDALLQEAERRCRHGLVLDGEFRISMAKDGRDIARPALFVDLERLRRWRPDEALPPNKRGTRWERALLKADARLRISRAVRDALIAAWHARLIERHQVAEIVRIVEQAFERIGPASRGRFWKR